MITATIGILLGVGIAISLVYIFAGLRPSAPIALVIIGWLLAGVSLYFTFGLTYAYLSMRHDPTASMGSTWGFLALLSGILLLLCLVISIYHARQSYLTWSREFGILMAEVGAMFFISMVLNQMIYSIAGSFREDSSVESILDSFAQARLLVACFHIAMVLVLFVVEGFGLGVLLRHRLINFRREIERRFDGTE